MSPLYQLPIPHSSFLSHQPLSLGRPRSHWGGWSTRKQWKRRTFVPHDGPLGGWSTGWLVHWVAGPLGGWSTGWLVGPLAGWSTGWLVHWVVGPLGGWSTGWLVHWVVGPLAGWSTGWLVGPLAGWSTGWLVSNTLHIHVLQGSNGANGIDGPPGITGPQVIKKIRKYILEHTSACNEMKLIDPKPNCRVLLEELA